MEWISNALGEASFLPHGYCLLWKPSLVYLHAGSDLLIALSYFAIPLAIFAYVRQRRDIGDNPTKVAFLFVAFIFACGLTHLGGLGTLWVPAYGIEGGVKFATAAISVATAIVFWRLLPQFVALPTPASVGTTMQSMLSFSASRPACSGAAPPKAISA